MQAAVWSQPHSSNSYCLSGIGARRKSSGYQPGTLSDISLSPPTEHMSPTEDDIESFSPINGKPVLGLGLALIISGSILGLFGIAGLFSRGEERLSIGLGALASLLALVAGVTGSRAGKNFSRNKWLAIQCAISSILCFIADIITIIFCAPIIVKKYDRLLQAIAGAEVFFAAVSLVLSFFCSIVTIKLLFEIPRPSTNTTEDPEKKIPKSVYSATF